MTFSQKKVNKKCIWEANSNYKYTLFFDNYKYCTVTSVDDIAISLECKRWKFAEFKVSFYIYKKKISILETTEPVQKYHTNFFFL